MPIVQFTSNLKRFYPSLKETIIEAKTIGELIEQVNDHYPGLKNYLTDDQKSLRHHVNIFINGTMIKDRRKLKDEIQKNDQVYIMQALSGG